ncbi:MAG: hypothetical protein IPK19_17455 [Chloroflexi bacterium]|nr:hypothetical protein [Chloroflexota bacterium]
MTFQPASLVLFEDEEPLPKWMRDLNEAHAAEAGRVNRLIKDLLATRLSNAEDAGTHQRGSGVEDEMIPPGELVLEALKWDNSDCHVH